MKPSAIIFDLDGTLLDTEKYYRAAWPVAVTDFGYPFVDAQALELRSLGRPFAPARFKEWYGADFDYKKVRDRRKELVEQMVKAQGVQLKPGAIELLSYMKEQGIMAAVATASPIDRTQRYLGLLDTDITGYFDRIISATQVAEGKPSPDVYQYACRELKLAPANCLAVEDAPNGILSATRAGIPTIMVPDQSEPDEELAKRLYACVPTLSDIIPLLM